MFFRIRQCHRLSHKREVRLFVPAAGAMPKEAKINLMDCICLCSEVEMDSSSSELLKSSKSLLTVKRQVHVACDFVRLSNAVN